MENVVAQAVAPLEQGPLGGFDLQPGGFGQADPADQLQFENAMFVSQNEGVDQISTTQWQPSLEVTASRGSESIGEAILDQLEKLKSNSEVVLEEIGNTLGKDNVSTTDMLQVQFQLMSLNVEIQTTSNMAHHGVEDIKTIMRGQ